MKTEDNKHSTKKIQVYNVNENNFQNISVTQRGENKSSVYFNKVLIYKCTYNQWYYQIMCLMANT